MHKKPQGGLPKVWLSSVDATTLYLSAISIMELELGILLIERRDIPQGPGYGPGWTAASSLNFRNRLCRLIRLWRFAALGFMCQTLAPTRMRSLRRPRSCMA